MLLILRISSPPKIIENIQTLINVAMKMKQRWPSMELKERLQEQYCPYVFQCSLLDVWRRCFLECNTPPNTDPAWKLLNLVTGAAKALCTCTLNHFKNSQEKCFVLKITTDSNPDRKSSLSIPKIEWVLQTMRKK